MPTTTVSHGLSQVTCVGSSNSISGGQMMTPVEQFTSLTAWDTKDEHDETKVKTYGQLKRSRGRVGVNLV